MNTENITIPTETGPTTNAQGIRQLTFDLPTRKKLEVNGEVYEILKGDVEIYREVIEVDKLLKSVDMSSPELLNGEHDSVLHTLDILIGGVDGILGKGAMEKITQGATLSLVLCSHVYSEVTAAVLDIYEQDVKDLYD